MSDDDATQEVPKEAKPDIVKMQIRVRDQDGGELQFKVKRTTPFEKVFIAYAERKGLAKTDCKFLFDGNILQGSNTPDELDMEDEDCIDMVREQIGGSARQHQAQ